MGYGADVRRGLRRNPFYRRNYPQKEKSLVMRKKTALSKRAVFILFLPLNVSIALMMIMNGLHYQHVQCLQLLILGKKYMYVLIDFHQL